MSRILVHTRRLSRRPMRARRAIAKHIPLVHAPARETPQWVVVGTGILGGAVGILAVIGLRVIA